MKLQFPHLTIGLLISISTVSQVSPSWADDAIHTGSFTAMSENGSYIYDPTSSTTGMFTYSIGAPNSPFWDSGAAKWDLTTYRGSNSGNFKDLDGNTGSYWQNYPLWSPGRSENNGGNSCSGASQTLLETADTVMRTFCTFQANGTYTYNIDTHTTNWLLGDPNGSFYSKGSFQYDPNTAGGSLNVYYQNNGTTGGYNMLIAPRVQPATQPDFDVSVPEPDSALLSTLAFAAVFGAGWVFKLVSSEE